MSYFQVSTSFTRPSDTNAYTSGDLVANSTTAGSVSPLTFPVALNSEILRAKIKKSGSTPTNANFTLLLFSSSPTVTNGDNGALAHSESNFLGTVALDATGSLASDATSITNSVSSIITSGTVYGLLKAGAAYTPASAEVFTVTLYGKN